MNEKDKRYAEMIINYCDRIADYLNCIDNDTETYLSDDLYTNW